MLDLLFYIFAGITLLSALLLVTSRNPVNAAMFMIVAFVGTGALFLLLEAYLLAALQVLVYAGAVVVLFLFIIMLLNVDQQTKTRPGLFTSIAALGFFALLVAGVGELFLTDRAPQPGALEAAPASVMANFGYELFTRYMLPFQVTGFLLLIAMIGIIVLSKRPPKQTRAAKTSAAGTEAVITSGS